jgi:hypothetical protein
MRVALILAPIFALLAGSIWFAGYAWNTLGEGGDPLPTYGYVAMAGGILFSVLIGCGLMALVFYSSRHGYDEAGNNERKID